MEIFHRIGQCFYHLEQILFFHQINCIFNNKIPDCTVSEMHWQKQKIRSALLWFKKWKNTFDLHLVCIQHFTIFICKLYLHAFRIALHMKIFLLKKAEAPMCFHLFLIRIHM